MAEMQSQECCAHQTQRGKQRRMQAYHPDHSSQIGRLNRVSGQLEGIKKMIDSRAYCPEILVQTRAAVSALKAIELNILETHIENCVSEAVSLKDLTAKRRKIRELMNVIGRF